MPTHIMIVSTGRADYGLFFPLITQLLDNPKFHLSLVATGTHLSPRHENTIDLIKQDGIPISHTISMTQLGDTEHDICIAISVGIKKFSQFFQKIHPDLIMVLGDRYELWSVGIAAVIHKTPLAHIHGGEATRGLIDDPIRHSITKMASLHFTSLKEYAYRIVQMGEHPKTVFPVGGLGVDNIYRMNLMSKQELFNTINMPLTDKPIALMTYHPVTLDQYENGKSQVITVLDALLDAQVPTLVTMPNSDTAGNSIYAVIEQYANRFSHLFTLKKNLGQVGYLSAMKHADFMIGNSSSGILESASFKLPVINIGDRQGGRFKPRNIITVPCNKKDITRAIKIALSVEFKTSIADLINPYGDGNTAQRIIDILEKIDLTHSDMLIKKDFYNLPLSSLHEIQSNITHI